VRYITGGGLLSRLFGTCATGLAIGLFIGLVQEMTKNAWLVVESGRLRGRQFRLDRPTLTVGRAEENVIGLFGDPDVQPRHAVISRTGSTWQIRNLAVASGTRINGRIIETAPLNENDAITIGNYMLRFHARGGSPAISSARPNSSAQPIRRDSSPPEPILSVGPTSISGQPCLVDAEGQRHQLKYGAPTTLGRALDNDIVVADPSVSRHHAQLTVANGGAELRDLGSQNGTFIGDQRISEGHIADGDPIGLGDARFTFRG